MPSDETRAALLKLRRSIATVAALVSEDMPKPLKDDRAQQVTMLRQWAAEIDAILAALPPPPVEAVAALRYDSRSAT